MATIVEKRAPSTSDEQRFVIYGIGWEGYETMLELLVDRKIRLTYDRGSLELMSPSHDHEWFSKRLGRVVETLADELNRPCRMGGATTWRRKVLDRGLEADQCYYLENTSRIIGKKIDLEVDPPPDLAVEVDITTSSLDRLGVYAGLGIPEIWRFDGESLFVYRLQPNGNYAVLDSSPTFPFLPMKEVARLLLEDEGEDTGWARTFRAWVREEILPRVQNAPEDTEAE